MISSVDDTLRSQTLPELLCRRAIRQPDRIAYRFVSFEGGGGEAVLRYGELHRRALAIAARLQAEGLAGERVILLYPNGLDFVAAFFGTLYAGSVAVPLVPPRAARMVPRIAAILSDVAAAGVLTTEAVHAKVLAARSNAIDDFRALRFVIADAQTETAAPPLDRPLTHPDGLAIIQYTSGSTSAPKGVKITHYNFLHNAAMMAGASGLSADSVGVNWLPLFHDMGLMGGVIQPLFAGFPITLLSPAAFLARPAAWLEVMSRYRATVTGAPNFAYDLCVERIADEHLARLDLSEWDVAYCGAEFIRADTLNGFAERFARCGFRRRSFFPCYGLAEATLIVSGGPKGAGTVVIDAGRRELERTGAVAAPNDAGDALRLVSSGRVIDPLRVAIVDPQTHVARPDGAVGEIWIGGPSVSAGYLNAPEGDDTFGAQLSGSAERFMRSGDLGFLRSGELFVVGRRKDLIIINGFNHYPEDIEHTVARSHAALIAGGGVAFASTAQERERLIVVHELKRSWRGDASGILGAIRAGIAEQHGIAAHAVLLVAPGSIPRTSSGKLQRHAVRAAFASGALQPVAAWRESDGRDERPESVREETPSVVTAELARVLGVHPGSIRTASPILSFAMDSVMVLRLRGAIAARTGVELDIAELFDDLTVGQLEERVRAGAGVAVPSLPLRSLGAGQGTLSFAQQRVWVLEQIQAVGAAHNISTVISLSGALDRAALEQSFAALVARHETLRTRFETANGLPLAVVDSPGRFRMRLADLSLAANEERATEKDRLVREETLRPFELKSDIPIRVTLLRLAPDEHVVVMVLHHIAADGWSLGILTREIAELYRSFTAGRPPALPPVPIRYADYAAWQRESLQGASAEKLSAYWKGQLAGAPAVLNLPTDRPRPALPSFKGAVRKLALPPELSAVLADFARAEGLTPFMVLLPAFQVLLWRWSGQEDIVVGATIAGRTRPETEDVVGFFVNLLPLRVSVDGDLSARELLGRAKAVALGAYAHQELPFEKMIEAHAIRDLSRQPIFQVLFALQNMPQQPLALSGLESHAVESESPTAKFDLSLYLQETPQGLQGYFEYATDLFVDSTIERLAEQYAIVLAAMLAAPQRRLCDLELMSARERDHVVVAWNATQAAYPSDQCLHDLFAAQAACTPDAVAVVHGDRRLSYGEIEARANRLAHHLRSLGVGPEAVVGLCMQRSAEMVVGLLGILKAGGAYLPLDPGYPQERLSYMLADSRAAVIVTLAGLDPSLPVHGVRMVRLDDDWDEIARRPATPPSSGASPDNLAYLIYTSGSTGKPKGVMGSHRIVVNRIAAQDGIDPFTDTDVCLQKTSISFVDAVFETLGPLTRGLPLIVLPAHLGSDPVALARLVGEFGVTRMIVVPSLLREMLSLPGIAAPLGSLRSVTASGEAVDADVCRRFFETLPHSRLVNLYGSSEVAADATWCRLAPADLDAPIGRPLPNVRVYVLDRSLAPVPIGAVGELCIGGAGLARGYFARAGLTAERFVPSPFGDGERLYRSGDLARWRADGKLDYLGRIDHQVKLRGYRIELGEIEAALRGRGGIKDAVVVARDAASGDKRLVAYVVAPADAFDARELRAQLKRSLPDYMVPSAFMRLDALPLTPSGKVARGALPAPEWNAPGAAYVAPRTAGEETLAAIWREVLGREQVGIDDNFFDLGGHSLLLVRVHVKLSATQRRQVPVTVLFQYPTIRGLADHLAGSHESDAHLRSSEQRGKARKQFHAARRTARTPAAPQPAAEIVARNNGA